MTAKQFARRAWPWALGLVIVVLVALRIPREEFARAITSGPQLALAAVDFGVVIAILLTDTVATWIALRVMDVPWTPRRTLWIRGATYVLALLNYAVGQGGIGYYLHRGGMPVKRATGVTLFTMGTTFATLLLVTTAAWAANGGNLMGAKWTLIGGCIAFALYLVVIAVRPAPIARVEWLAPLFETGLRGHAIAIVARLPHVALIVLGHWFAMLAWGIEVPFAAAATVMPIVVVASVLPISLAGLGTTQVALTVLFHQYAAGGNAEVFAFSIVHFVYAMVGQLVVGLACVPFARRELPAQAD